MKRWRCVFFFLLGILCFGLPIRVSAAAGVKGIDVSENNGTVNWALVQQQGYSYAMIKTGDGQAPANFTDDVDEQFEVNYSGAGAAGLKRGVYHVCCTRTPEGAAAEAEYCLQILNGRPLEYPVAYDMEMPGNFAGGKKNTTAMAKAFCDVIRSAGYTPMIYSSVSHLNSDFNWNNLKNVQVWVADVGVKATSFTGVYHIWQYSHTGTVAGAGNTEGNTDLNYSYLEYPQKIKVKKKSITLKKGKTYTIKVTLTPATVYQTLKYSSSKKSVATVSSKGVIRAKKKGKAKIRIKTVNGKKAVITVKVK